METDILREGFYKQEAEKDKRFEKRMRMAYFFLYIYFAGNIIWNIIWCFTHGPLNCIPLLLNATLLGWNLGYRNRRRFEKKLKEKYKS